jgi:hypothetical protein
MTRHPYGETVIHHPHVRDDRNAHGKLVPVYGPDVEIEHVAVAPGRQTEAASGGESTVTVEWTLYVPDPSVTIGARDHVTVRGVKYAVEGDMAGPWRNPFNGRTPGSVVELKKVTG